MAVSAWPRLMSICPVHGNGKIIVGIDRTPGKELIACAHAGPQLRQNFIADWAHPWIDAGIPHWSTGIDIVHWNLLKAVKAKFDLGSEPTQPNISLSDLEKYPGFCPKCNKRAYVGLFEIDHLRGGSKCLLP